MNKIKKETFTRSDIEISLKKEFPHLTKLQIVNAINVIQDTIIDAVALDERVEIRGFGTFSKKIIRPRRFVNSLSKCSLCLMKFLSDGLPEYSITA